MLNRCARLTEIEYQTLSMSCGGHRVLQMNRLLRNSLLPDPEKGFVALTAVTATDDAVFHCVCD